MEARDGKETLELFYQNPDLSLIILDIMMPEFSGMEVLKKIRQQSQIPVLVLTALGDSANELKGFQGGANDYMAKPFHPEILLARAENLMRMVHNDARQYLQVGEIVADQNRRRVFVKDDEISLTHKEYQLLIYLMHNRDIVLSRDQILEKSGDLTTRGISDH